MTKHELAVRFWREDVNISDRTSPAAEAGRGVGQKPDQQSSLHPPTRGPGGSPCVERTWDDVCPWTAELVSIKTSYIIQDGPVRVQVLVQLSLNPRCMLCGVFWQSAGCMSDSEWPPSLKTTSCSQSQLTYLSFLPFKIKHWNIFTDKLQIIDSSADYENWMFTCWNFSVMNTLRHVDASDTAG